VDLDFDPFLIGLKTFFVGGYVSVTEGAFCSTLVSLANSVAENSIGSKKVIA